ncbi:MAG: hypothetical protein ABI895_38405 [Deltaproteobacteria bacterium]
MISSETLAPARPATAWRRLWSPERLLGRHKGLRVYQLGLALAFLLLLHAIVVNVLLLSGALGWFLSRATGVLKVETGRSFSLWPGVVHLRQLHLEAKDSSVHLELEVPSGRANILLRQLFVRRFSVAGVTGEHFVLRLRPKFQDFPERRLAALPPLSEPTTEPPGPGEPPYLWPVHIEGVAAQFDELWLSELRYRGDAFASGGFELVPLERVSVYPSDVALRGGSVSYGPERQVLELERVALHAELQQTEVQELVQHWNERIAGRVELAGRVVELGFLANLSPKLEGISDGRGELGLVAGAERGQWVGDFDLTYAARRIGYAHGIWTGSSALSLTAHSAASGAAEPAGPLPVALRLDDTGFDAREQRVARLEQARLDSQWTRVFPFAAPEALAIDMQGLALERLEALPKALRPGHWLPHSAYLAKTHAVLAWREGVASGNAETRFRELSFSIGEWALRQSGTIALEGVRFAGLDSPLRLSAAKLVLDPMQIRGPETQIDSWNLKLDLEQLAFVPAAQRWTAEFVAAGDDAQPVLSLLGVHGLPPGVAEFLAMPDLRVHGSVDLAPGRQELSVDRAESKTIDVKGRLIRRAEQNRAAFLFQAAPLSLGVDVQPGDTSVKLFAGDAWLQARLDRLASAP